MEQTTQAILTVGMPTLAVLVGILVNNSRLTDLRVHMDARFAGIEQRITDLKETLRAELRRVEEVLDARLKHLEEERHGS